MIDIEIQNEIDQYKNYGKAKEDCLLLQQEVISSEDTFSSFYADFIA
ncbi:MAG: hypothetical protein R2769_10455 [Saprospiraceae bacterium]